MRLATLLLVLLGCAVSGLASAEVVSAQATGATAARSGDGADAQLAAARELVLHASYRNALPACVTYLERSDLSAVQRNQGLELLAIIHLALRDEVSARQALSELLARDPDYRLSDPDVSPVVLSAFARARAQARPVAVVLAHDPPLLTRRRAPLVSVRVEENGGAVSEIRLHHRQRGERRAGTVVLRLGAEATAEGRLPLASEDTAYTAEYWIEAVAPSGFVLGRRGSETEPLAIVIPASAPETIVVRGADPVGPTQPQGGDVTSEAWFWALIGVVVVGAAAGVTVGVVLGGQGAQDGSLGNINLPLVAF